MLTKASITTTTHNLVGEYLGFDAAEINNDKRFQEDLQADSLDEVEMVMAVEDEFNIEISDDDANSVKTVGDLIDLIARLTNTTA